MAGRETSFGLQEPESSRQLGLLQWGAAEQVSLGPSDRDSRPSWGNQDISELWIARSNLDIRLTAKVKKGIQENSVPHSLAICVQGESI